MGIGYQEDIAPTLNAGQSCAVFAVGNCQAHNTQIDDVVGSLNCMHDQQAILCMATQQGGVEIGKDVCPAITAAAGMSGNNQPVLCYAVQGNCIDRSDTAVCNGKGCRENQMYTLNTVDRHAVAYGVDCRNGCLYEEVNGTLQAKDGGYNYNSNNTILYCYAVDRASFNQGQNAQYKPKIDDSGICMCLVAMGPHAVGICERIRFILRRITPTECARLQGMPDWWCDDVQHSDAQEYKMWGNGIALPCALYVMEGLKRESEETTWQTE